MVIVQPKTATEFLSTLPLSELKTIVESSRGLDARLMSTESEKAKEMWRYYLLLTNRWEWWESMSFEERQAELINFVNFHLREAGFGLRVMWRGGANHLPVVASFLERGSAFALVEEDEIEIQSRQYYGQLRARFREEQGRQRQPSESVLQTQKPLPLERIGEESFRIFTGLDESVLREMASPAPWSNILADDRNCVNWLRHNRSNYDKMLQFYGSKAYLHIFRRFNQLIASHYPWLKDECERQIEQKEKQVR